MVPSLLLLLLFLCSIVPVSAYSTELPSYYIAIIIVFLIILLVAIGIRLADKYHIVEQLKSNNPWKIGDDDGRFVVRKFKGHSFDYENGIVVIPKKEGADEEMERRKHPKRGLNFSALKNEDAIEMTMSVPKTRPQSEHGYAPVLRPGAGFTGMQPAPSILPPGPTESYDAPKPSYSNDQVFAVPMSPGEKRGPSTTKTPVTLRKTPLSPPANSRTPASSRKVPESPSEKRALSPEPAVVLRKSRTPKTSRKQETPLSPPPKAKTPKTPRKQQETPRSPPPKAKTPKTPRKQHETPLSPRTPKREPDPEHPVQSSMVGYPAPGYPGYHHPAYSPGYPGYPAYHPGYYPPPPAGYYPGPQPPQPPHMPNYPVTPPGPYPTYPAYPMPTYFAPHPPPQPHNPPPSGPGEITAHKL